MTSSRNNAAATPPLPVGLVGTSLGLSDRWPGLSVWYTMYTMCHVLLDSTIPHVGSYMVQPVLSTVRCWGQFYPPWLLADRCFFFEYNEKILQKCLFAQDLESSKLWSRYILASIQFYLNNKYKNY